VHSPTLLTFVTGVERGATSRELCDVSIEDAYGRSAVTYRAFTYLPGWQPYCETLAMLAALLVAALWLVPRQVTALLAEHARLVRAKQAKRAAAATDAATSGAAAPPADKGSGGAARAAGAASASAPPMVASVTTTSPGEAVRGSKLATRSGPYTADQLL
jgi:hypothetical protein